MQSERQEEVTESTVSSPLVSVIIPVFNAARFIQEAIDSTLKQTYKNFEIIVIDDGSTDNTKEILLPYIEEGLIRYVFQNNQGPGSARNTGIKASQGEFIAFLDADDCWENNKLAHQVDYVSQNPDIVLVHTGKKLFGELGKRGYDEAKIHMLCQSVDFVSLLICNPIFTGSVMMRKDALLKAGLFDITLIRCEDHDLWLRVAKIGRFGYIPDNLSNYRIHRAQLTSKADGWCDDSVRVMMKNKHLVSSFPEYLAWRKGYSIRLLDGGYYWEQKNVSWKALYYFFRSLLVWPFDNAFLKLKSMIRVIVR